MPGFLREHSWSLAFSVLLHAALAAAFLVAALITVNKTLPTVLPLPVDGVVVDSQVLSAAQKTLTDRAEQEAARAKAAADARAAAEAAVKEKAAADQKQAQDEADAQAKAKVAAQVSAAKSAAAAEQARADDAKKRAAEADQAAAAKRAQDAQRAEDAKRAEQQKREAEAKAADDAKKAADQRAKSEREAELKRQLAEEERVSAVQSGPLRDQYIAQLQNRIQRAWIRPPSARVGLDCLVQVTQVAGGEVTSAQVTQCNGDTAARQSIENAVYRASPLPSPPDPALFMKTFSFRFHPDQ
ncbi:MAG: colicin import rane protein [Gammaproteobacteria bacterium]|jgi:colicin import membrane protein|nr:colicin import rane protein [Gammaproteobacteria bacterium]